MNREDTDGDRAMRDRIDQISLGYALSSILFTAIDLRLFDHLAEGPCDAETLGRRAGASASGVARLASALCALGFLRREADGRFAAIPAALRLLAGDGDASLAPVVRFHHRQVAPLMAHLGDAVRSARPQHAAWPFASPGAADRHSYEELARHPEEYRRFLEAMDRFGIGTGTAIASSFDLQPITRLIDLGGASGRISCELLQAAPHLTIEMIDVALGCRMAERKAEEAGVAGRFRATEADLTKALPATIEPGDAVLLSGILADWTSHDRARILANAAALLRPGGVLLVSETLLDEDRTGPMVPVVLSLVMLVTVPGDSFGFAELRSVLEEAGFSAIERRPPRQAGGRDLIIARR